MLPSFGFRRLGATPLPILLTTLIALDLILPARLGAGSTFDPAYLNAVLSTIFVSMTSWSVAYISLRSYLQNSSMTMLLLGCAGLAWGSTLFVGTWVPNFTGAVNMGITIANTGGLIASILHVASGALTSTRSTAQVSRAPRKLLLGTAYGSVILVTAILTISTILGLTPAFYIPGSGQTLVRMTVLIAASSLFAVAAILFARIYSQSKSGTLYWYFMALALTAIGLVSVFFGRVPGDPISWTGRIAQFLGGVYFLKAVQTTF